MAIVENYVIDIEQPIGSGSYSKVYRCTCLDKVYEKELAVKVIDTCMFNKKIIEIFKNEINIIEFLMLHPHPNIVEFYDMFCIDNTYYIVMEYCYYDLKSLIKKPMKESIVQFYISQLRNGIKFLHDNNIIHRDIKPANLLLDKSKQILKITDFGFSKKLDKIDSLQNTICGSPMYMSPEILYNKSYSNISDLWSIGILIFEMLYGYNPYNTCTSIEEIRNKIDEKIHIPQSNGIKISDNCVNLIDRLLCKDVSKRMTWIEFFNNEWLTQHEYINIWSDRIPVENDINTININREKTITTLRVGSLPNLNIIDKYYGSDIFTME